MSCRRRFLLREGAVSGGHGKLAERDVSKMLRQCGVDWLESRKCVHHPLQSSAKCKDLSCLWTTAIFPHKGQFQIFGDRKAIKTWLLRKLFRHACFSIVLA